MEINKTKEELKDLIQKLNKDDFKKFCDNYSVDGSKFELIEQWVDKMDNEEDLREVITEIHFNSVSEFFNDAIFGKENK